MGLALSAGRARELGRALIAGVRDNALGVVVLLALNRQDGRLDGVLLGLAQRQLGAGVALEQLDGEPARLRRLAVRADLLCDQVQRVLQVLAKRQRLCRLAGLGRLDGRLGRLDAVLALERADLNHRHAQRLGQGRRLDGAALLAHDVHHVQRNHDRNAKLHELGGQIQVAFQVGRVDDVENRVGLLGDQIVAADHFFQCVWRKRVDTRQILDGDIGMALEPAFLLFNGDAGPVADVLACTGQGIKQCGLATVRVARQCDFHPHE